MNRSRERCSLSRFAFSVGLIAVLAGVAGCAAPTGSAEAGPTADDGPVVTSSPTMTSATTVTDKESCDAFGDVTTITFNADLGLQDGRMAQQEHDGWYRLATRVLDRVPTSGTGTVSDTIAALKQAAPPIPLGTPGTTGFNTDEWNTAAAPLLEACNAAGSDLASEGFTGG